MRNLEFCTRGIDDSGYIEAVMGVLEEQKQLQMQMQMQMRPRPRSRRSSKYARATRYVVLY
jgi:hypothetical protein